MSVGSRPPWGPKAVSENREQAGEDAVAVGDGEAWGDGARRPPERIQAAEASSSGTPATPFGRSPPSRDSGANSTYPGARLFLARGGGAVRRDPRAAWRQNRILESEDDLGLDSLYVRDASVVALQERYVYNGKQGKSPPPPLEDFSILTSLSLEARSAEPRAQVALENCPGPPVIEFPHR